jgi:DNA-binding response OmpR family regulator
LRGEGSWSAKGGEWCRRFMVEAGSHFEYYWRHLSDDERYTLAALPLTQGDEARREAVHALERACLIRREGQVCVYLCPPFEEFVRQQTVPRLLQLGPFLLDLSRQAALCDYAPLKVTKTEFKALAHLMRRAGQVVTPEELEKALWGDAYVEDPERVRAVIKSLRKALGERAECLATKWGVGYLFQISS